VRRHLLRLDRPAMDEAITILQNRGNRLDMLRIRAFPFHQDVPDFIAEHEFVFLVEQNRDAQLRSLIVNKRGVDPIRSCRSCTTTAPRSRRDSSPGRSGRIWMR
jgi:hypothetical protein